MPDCSSLASTGSAGYGAGLEQEAWSRKLMQLEKHLDLYICSYPFGAYSKPNATPGGMALGLAWGDILEEGKVSSWSSLST